MIKYGHKPFRVVVIHGGPGVLGEVAPIAIELSLDSGVLEPQQTVGTIEGQVEELRSALESNGSLPLIMIGFSWGHGLVISLQPFILRSLRSSFSLVVPLLKKSMLLAL